MGLRYGRKKSNTMKFSSALVANLGLLAKAESGDCPDGTCWTKSDDGTACVLNPDCTTIECGATEMTFTYTPDILGIGKGDLVKTTGGSQIGGTVNGDGVYELTCQYDNLAACGMGLTVDADNDKLFFEVSLSDSSEARPEESSDMADIPIKLDDGTTVTIQRQAYGLGVIYRCNYSLTTTVSSEDFAVEAVSIDGTQEGTGSLSDSFELELNGGSPDTIILGDFLTVKATWKLSNLSQENNLYFHLENCSVDYSPEVFVIKEACYAEALGSTYLDEHTFKFKTFAVESSDVDSGSHAQTIKCTIRICEDNGTGTELCNKKEVKDAVCTNFSQDDAAYGFKNVADDMN